MSHKFTCNAVLFDLDGVLIDSTPNILRHWKTWADEHGMDIREIERVAHGLRTVETMRLVAPHLDAEQEARLFAEHELKDLTGITAVEGARELITSFNGMKWAVVTSGCRKLVHLRMGQAGLPVPEYLVTADDVISGKPSPEPYLKGAQLLGVKPQNCLVVEDAPAGIEAGTKAGMRVVAVASTHTRAMLAETQADGIVDRLADIQISPTGDGQILVTCG